MTFKKTLDQTNEETTLTDGSVCGDCPKIINQNTALSQSLIVINFQNFFVLTSLTVEFHIK